MVAPKLKLRLKKLGDLWTQRRETQKERGNYSLSTSVKSTFFDAAKTNIRGERRKDSRQNVG